MDIALQSNHTEVAKILENLGAVPSEVSYYICVLKYYKNKYCKLFGYECHYSDF